MKVNMTDICQDIKNYFIHEIYTGKFTISEGKLQNVALLPGQYFRVVGSILNEGVWQYPEDVLQDETFTGAVWAMAVPPAVISLTADINDWLEANSEAINSPFQSESFDSYAYNKGSNGSGGEIAWQSHFAKRLNQWRRIHI